MSFMRSLTFLAFTSLLMGSDCNKDEDTEETTDEVAPVSPTIPQEALEKPGAVEWGYKGSGGPSAWGEMKAEFAKCSLGRYQSPVDLPLPTADSVGDPPGALRFEYQPIPMRLWNTGTTVQVENTVKNALFAGGKRFDLTHIQFHSPSEHSIGGQNYDLEMQLVHRNAAREQVVVSVLLQKGRENASMKPVWDYLPIEKATGALEIPGVYLDVRGLLPVSSRYYTYWGSDTTPPCSEGNRWFVLAPTAEASHDQVQRFRAVTQGNTNRPVQPLNGRVVSIFAP